MAQSWDRYLSDEDLANLKSVCRKIYTIISKNKKLNSRLLKRVILHEYELWAGAQNIKTTSSKRKFPMTLLIDIAENLRYNGNRLMINGAGFKPGQALIPISFLSTYERSEVLYSKIFKVIGASEASDSSKAFECATDSEKAMACELHVLDGYLEDQKSLIKVLSDVANFLGSQGDIKMDPEVTGKAITPLEFIKKTKGLNKVYFYYWTILGKPKKIAGSDKEGVAGAREVFFKKLSPKLNDLEIAAANSKKIKACQLFITERRELIEAAHPKFLFG